MVVSACEVAQCGRPPTERRALPMSKIVSEVLEANRSYAQNFGKKGELAPAPAQRLRLLTCMDARLDPAKYAGLTEGDAHIIRNAGGRATEDAIRSLVISHKLLGTNEWFVIHHTNCGMELFSDEMIADLLEDDLATASFDGKKWSNPHHRGGHTAGHFHQMAHDQEPGGGRRAGRAAYPGASAGSPQHPDPRLYLRREDRSPERSEGGDRSGQSRSGLAAADYPRASSGASGDLTIRNERPQGDRITQAVESRDAVLPDRARRPREQISRARLDLERGALPFSSAFRRKRREQGASSETPTTSSNCALSRCQPIPAPGRYSLMRTWRKDSARAIEKCSNLMPQR